MINVSGIQKGNSSTSSTSNNKRKDLLLEVFHLAAKWVKEHHSESDFKKTTYLTFFSEGSSLSSKDEDNEYKDIITTNSATTFNENVVKNDETQSGPLKGFSLQKRRASSSVSSSINPLRSSAVLLKLYGLYKRATQGACNIRKPNSYVDVVARSRYESWKLESHLSEREAILEYIELVAFNFKGFEEKYRKKLGEIKELSDVLVESKSTLQLVSDLYKNFKDQSKSTMVDINLQLKMINKAGYLYKWRSKHVGFDRDRNRWRQLYFLLNGSTLSFFENSLPNAQPWRVINLQNCAIKLEGTKELHYSWPYHKQIAETYFIFAIYEVGTADHTLSREKSQQSYMSDPEDCEDDEDEFPTINKGENGDLDDASSSKHLLIRLSTTSHADCQEWFHEIGKACSLATYLEKNNNNSKDLNFNNFKNKFIKVDDDDTLSDDTPTTEKIALLQQQKEKESLEPFIDKSRNQMGHHRKERKSNREDQPVLKESTEIISMASIKRALSEELKSRVPSSDEDKNNNEGLSNFVGERKKENLLLHQLESKQQQQKKRVKFDPFNENYRASKIVHKSIETSILSFDNIELVPDYRGFYNLAIIVLIVANFGMVLEYIVSHEDNLFNFRNGESTFLLQVWEYFTTEWEIWTCIFCLQIFILLAVFIERMAAFQIISSEGASILHSINIMSEFFIVTYVAWTSNQVMGANIVLLFISSILWLKLISYAQTNAEYRLDYFKEIRQKKFDEPCKDRGDSNATYNSQSGYSDIGSDPLRTILSNPETTPHDTRKTLANLVEENSEPPLKRTSLSINSTSLATASGSTSALSPSSETMSNSLNFGRIVKYPKNLTFDNIYYFWFAPTLCYQLNYPRTKRIRFRYTCILLVVIFSTTFLMGFIGKTQIQPKLSESMIYLDRFHIMGSLSTLFNIALPCTYVWLCFFYLYFHCVMILFAELTCFGDRTFYKSWWNATTFGSYWRLWNLPVHNWLVRHMYFPLLRKGYSKWQANFLVFLFSAVMHEYLVSVPLHQIRIWAFLGMLGQAPLVFLTDYLNNLPAFKSSQVGNFAFWVIFCMVGQPLGVLMYYRDSQDLKK